MINENTLFILGAGASCPYGFPSGALLRIKIIKKYKSLLQDLIRTTNSFDEADIDAILNDLRKFLPEYETADTFIDLFLSRRPSFERIGKIGIILSILDAERTSKFREDIEDYQLNWYSYLFNKLTEDMSEPNSYKRFSENKINFITFNYDRSLEHYLSETLAANFDLKNEQIKIAFENIKFEHVYGQIADLPWQSNNEVLPYLVENQTIKLSKLYSLLENIYLIQDRKTIKNREKIIELIRDSSRIYFLGFSYLNENMDVLNIMDNTSTETHKIYGTAYKLKESEINVIMNKYFYKFMIDDVSNSRSKMKKLNIRSFDNLELLREYPLE